MKKLVVGIVGELETDKSSLVRRLNDYPIPTISKNQARLEEKFHSTTYLHLFEISFGDYQITVINTPGKLDFINQLEVCLPGLDCAIFTIPTDGKISGESLMIWRLLRHYHVPTFIFINGEITEQIVNLLQKKLSAACCSFEHQFTKATLETIALLDESLLQQYLAQGRISTVAIKSLIKKQKVFPCYSNELTTEDLVSEITSWAPVFQEQKQNFSGCVMQVESLTAETSLVYLRVMSGHLRVKELLAGEKVNQLQMYINGGLKNVSEVKAGDICLIKTASRVLPGQYISKELLPISPYIKPSLTFSVVPTNRPIGACVKALKTLQYENPTLSVKWNKQIQEIKIKLFGSLEGKVLRYLLSTRFDIDIELTKAHVEYKETISRTVEGIGHYSPLRHYSEVHLVMRPSKIGSGLTFKSECSTNVLPANWQQVVKNEVQQAEIPGVLIGAPITDIECTLVGGISNLAHSGSEDFRKSTRRAIRQGLMMLWGKNCCQILEPLYYFELTIPQENIRQAMSDIQEMAGQVNKVANYNDMLTLKGYAPVSEMQNYFEKVREYTHNQGYLYTKLTGYQPCHDQSALVTKSSYDPLTDRKATANSVFCINKVNTNIEWDKLPQYSYYPPTKYAIP